MKAAALISVSLLPLATTLEIFGLFRFPIHLRGLLKGWQPPSSS